VIHQPGVTSAIVGSRNATHVRANAGASAVVLDAAVLADIDAVLA
jgi:aryl-alcohol dehydrogenase-like predicted oxidoreductase